MYLVVRQYRLKNPDDVEEARRRVARGFVPMLSRTAGFIAYYGLEPDDGTVASVGIFRDQASADASNLRAADWMWSNLEDLIDEPIAALAGPVTVQREA